jgi:hypothetical protein
MSVSCGAQYKNCVYKKIYVGRSPLMPHDPLYVGVAALVTLLLVIYLATFAKPAYPDGCYDKTSCEVKTRLRHPPKPRSHDDCSSPFGQQVGTALGVAAFSNCNDDYTSSYYSAIPMAALFGPQSAGCDMSACPQNVTTGLEWQCVEYARRTMLLRHQAMFESIPGASDIWGLDTIQKFTLGKSTTDGSCACTTRTVNWTTVANGASDKIWVQVGDLVIYDKGTVGPFGHVCVVAGFASKKSSDPSNVVARVLIGEENWYNAAWPVPSGPEAYARQLLLVANSHGTLDLQDDPVDGIYPIFGVKRVQD